MQLLIKDIVNKLETFVPLCLQEDWDNSGYQIKFGNEPPLGIITSLDCTYECVDFAIKSRANLILTHHPLFFHSLKSVNFETAIGKSIEILSKNKISVYAVHTNFDYSCYNTSRYIADKIGIKQYSPLVPSKRKFYKLSVFIPKGYVNLVREAIFGVSPSIIGNYENCSFESRGRGSFKPLHGSNPFIGGEGKISFTDESRLELLIDEKDIENAVNALKSVHPYEEVAYDIYPVINKGIVQNEGLGAVGDLNENIKFNDFLDIVKKELSPSYINYTGNLAADIKKIGIVSGSGFSFIDDAIKSKCDVFISSELSHSRALKSYETGMCLLDLPHFDTEKYFVPIMKNLISKNFNIPIAENKSESCPILSYK